MEFPGLDQEEFSEGFQHKKPIIAHIHLIGYSSCFLHRYQEDVHKNNAYIRFKINEDIYDNNINSLIDSLKCFNIQVKSGSVILTSINIRVTAFLSSFYNKKIKLIDTRIDYDNSGYDYEPGLYLDVPIHMDVDLRLRAGRFTLSCKKNIYFTNASLWFLENTELNKECFCHTISSTYSHIRSKDRTLMFFMFMDLDTTITKINDEDVDDCILIPYIWHHYKVYILSDNYKKSEIPNLRFYLNIDQNPKVYTDEGQRVDCNMLLIN